MHSIDMSTHIDNRQKFLLLSEQDRKDILQTLGNKMGQSPAVLEKDIWVCWALGTLFSIPNILPMAFKGGTSLSKVYNAIDRFSEDIDITLDYKSLATDADPFKEDITASQLNKLTKTLRQLVSKHTHDVVVPAFAAAMKADFSEHNYELNQGDDGEQLFINYQPLFHTAYLTDQVLIEFGGRNAITPSKPVTIKPYVADALPELELPTAAVTVLAAERTFWEKITLLHYECNVCEVEKLERKSRHWYDIYKLAQMPIGEAALQDTALLRDVVKHKKAFYNKKGANYDLCLENKMSLVPNDELLKALEHDYRKMVAEGMFNQSVPEFSAIVSDLKKLESRINSTS
jgi:predicted nucleotidyltransferase component of viral defense system